MSKATKDYLTNIPDEVQLKLLTFLNGTKQILAFHLETFYPALTNCDLNISSICDVFKRHMEAKSFHIYNVYAAYVREALGLLASYLSPEVNLDTIIIDNLSIILIGSKLIKKINQNRKEARTAMNIYVKWTML